MSTPEKFCLKWNDFQENVNAAFKSLREDDAFSDVTLACEDGQQVEAHKVILAASSPFFKNLLRRNKHSHPLIYMKAIKYIDLVAILDFLYYGETKIYQENLDNFLNIAEELNLKGLTGEGPEKSTPQENTRLSDESVLPPNQNTIEETKISHDPEMATNMIQHNDHEAFEWAVALPREEFSGDLQELDTRIKSMMVMGLNKLPNRKDKAYVCQVCGKEGQSGSIKDHIEANHIGGISIPCTFCSKTFR